MVRFFEKVLAEEKKQQAKLEEQGGDLAKVLSSTMGYLSSHPATDERIAEINAMIGSKTYAYRDLADQFEQLQTIVRRFVSEPNTDGEN
jgi:predicted Zn-dependent protease